MTESKWWWAAAIGGSRRVSCTAVMPSAAAPSSSWSPPSPTNKQSSGLTLRDSERYRRVWERALDLVDKGAEEVEKHGSEDQPGVALSDCLQTSALQSTCCHVWQPQPPSCFGSVSTVRRSKVGALRVMAAD